MESSKPIEEAIIIGAGLAGLTVAYHLAKRGVSPLLLDRGESLGSSWQGRHPQLSLNTHRTVSHLPGLAYAEKTPAFPRRDDVVRHLIDFSRIHEFNIHSGIEINSITHRNGRFLVESRQGTIAARNVVVATGRDRKPVQPLIRGIETFPGERLHASAFGDAKQYSGRRVLVIGGGNSGFDIVNHLSLVPDVHVWLSVRSGSAILPKRFKGVAIHRLSPLMDALPLVVSDLAIALSQRLAFGDVRKLGFPRPTAGAATRLHAEQVAIPVDDGAIRSIRNGKTEVVAGVVTIDDKIVHVEGGKMIKPDTIITATGYSAGLGALLDGLGVTDAKGNPILSRDRVSSSVSGLYFAGMTPGLVSYFRNADREGRQIAQLIAR